MLEAEYVNKCTRALEKKNEETERIDRYERDTVLSEFCLFHDPDVVTHLYDSRVNQRIKPRPRRPIREWLSLVSNQSSRLTDRRRTAATP